ncbi:alpha-galactosidase [Arenicella xantha]|nr:alpha-galactosidase [Arenicella xantha]
MSTLIHVSGTARENYTTDASAQEATQNGLVFNLSNQRISYVFRVSREGILEHLHFGARVSPQTDYPSVPRRLHRGCVLEFQDSLDYNLTDIPQEYPVFGTTDNRTPAFHAQNCAGNTTTVLRYVSHQVVNDKPALTGLPSARGADHGASETLIVSLGDAELNLLVRLHYTIYAEHDLIARSVEINNQSTSSINITHAMSSSLDLPCADYEVLHLHGTWAREMNAQRHAIPYGRFVLESATGTSGNVHNPFIALMDSTTTEHHGDVIGTALVYSGNFAISVERGEFGAVRLTSGINPFNFAWNLAPGETFTSPESLHVFSADGLNGMSQVWHRFVREQISPPAFKSQPRPTYLNSWEAAYFDIDEDSVLALADRTKALGLEMLVVDDGWFEGRNDDTTSLGDWFADAKKFPNGIESVAAKVKAKGLKFGLWFEPEMVNPDSQLFRAHPDWIIGVPQRSSSKGRNQLTLDLGRIEVQQYLFDCIDKLLACGDIDYVKWDMNRTMSEIGSFALDASRQQETAHRYLLGVYALVGRLVAKYPNVLFENCASGGNRFDLGMLSYMAQTWTSDMSEPIGRLPIQNGASYVFPPSVLASYICPVPSHLNGRQVSLQTRADVGFFCAARGLSLNANDVDQDFEALAAHAQHYQQTAQDAVEGSFFRLRYDQNEVCWQLMSADGARIYLGYFHILSEANLPLRRIRLVALDPQQQYRLADNDHVYGGDALMHLGLDLPHVCAMQRSSADYLPQGDFASRIIVLTRQ